MKSNRSGQLLAQVWGASGIRPVLTLVAFLGSISVFASELPDPSPWLAFLEQAKTAGIPVSISEAEFNGLLAKYEEKSRAEVLKKAPEGTPLVFSIHTERPFAEVTANLDVPIPAEDEAAYVAQEGTPGLSCATVIVNTYITGFRCLVPQFQYQVTLNQVKREYKSKWGFVRVAVPTSRTGCGLVNACRPSIRLKRSSRLVRTWTVPVTHERRSPVFAESASSESYRARELEKSTLEAASAEKTLSEIRSDREQVAQLQQKIAELSRKIDAYVPDQPKPRPRPKVGEFFFFTSDEDKVGFLIDETLAMEGDRQERFKRIMTKAMMGLQAHQELRLTSVGGRKRTLGTLVQPMKATPANLARASEALLKARLSSSAYGMPTYNNGFLEILNSDVDEVLLLTDAAYCQSPDAIFAAAKRSGKMINIVHGPLSGEYSDVEDLHQIVRLSGGCYIQTTFDFIVKSIQCYPSRSSASKNQTAKTDPRIQWRAEREKMQASLRAMVPSAASSAAATTAEAKLKEAETRRQRLAPPSP